MTFVAYEGVVKNGHIQLPENASLPESGKSLRYGRGSSDRSKKAAARCPHAKPSTSGPGDGGAF